MGVHTEQLGVLRLYLVAIYSRGPAPPVEVARIADASEGSVETGASKDTGGSFSELNRLRWASRWSTPASTSTVEWRARTRSTVGVPAADQRAELRWKLWRTL